jgi:hypothetical protein
MTLNNYIEVLQKLIQDNPNLANFTIKFRTRSKQEDFVYYHTEGRTLIFSESWANDILTPGHPGYDKLKEKIKLLEPSE